MLKLTKIAPVNGSELPLSWANLAAVSPGDAVQVIIQPFTTDTNVLNPDTTESAHDAPVLSSYLLRCNLYSYNADQIV